MRVFSLMGYGNIMGKSQLNPCLFCPLNQSIGTTDLFFFRMVGFPPGTPTAAAMDSTAAVVSAAFSTPRKTVVAPAATCMDSGRLPGRHLGTPKKYGGNVENPEKETTSWGSLSVVMVKILGSPKLEGTLT